MKKDAKKEDEKKEVVIKGHKVRTYGFKVEAHGTEPWSGPHPDDVHALVARPPREIEELRNLVLKTTIVKLCAQGLTVDATKLLDEYNPPEDYRFPLNGFARDRQNGKAIYQGAYCFLGALRDSLDDLYNPFYKSASDKGKKSSDKHFRKQVKVVPHHVFLMRNKKPIYQPDLVDPQQPVGSVTGFARYEVIEPPFNFSFTVRIIVAGKFRELLGDEKRMQMGIENSPFFGQCARRGAGCGGWEIDSLKKVTWSPWRI